MRKFMLLIMLVVGAVISVPGCVTDENGNRVFDASKMVEATIVIVEGQAASAEQAMVMWEASEKTIEMHRKVVGTIMIAAHEALTTVKILETFDIIPTTSQQEDIDAATARIEAVKLQMGITPADVAQFHAENSIITP